MRTPSHSATPPPSAARPQLALSLLAASRILPLVALTAAALPANAAQTNAPPAPATAITVERFATGLEHPWGLQFLSDGRKLVTERPGRMRVVGEDGKLSPPISGVPAVHARGQGGLLDVRLAPDFASSGLIYFSYSEPRGSGESATAVARAKLVLEAGTAGGALQNVEVIFRQQPARSTSHHYGSRVVIAPDGTLFVTTGERGASDMAQDPKTMLGKVIRINGDGSVPKDNPAFPGWAPEVWSIGHRNLQGAAIDPATGKLWTVEHGARGGDELNHPEAGKNYGWPIISYGRHYTFQKIGEGTAKEGMEQPVYYWDPSIATSGLTFVTTDHFPGWKGNVLVGGLSHALISRLVFENGTVVAEEKLLQDQGHRIRDVREGPDGAIYALVDDSDGAILKISPGSKK